MILNSHLVLETVFIEGIVFKAGHVMTRAGEEGMVMGDKTIFQGLSLYIIPHDYCD